MKLKEIAEAYRAEVEKQQQEAYAARKKIEADETEKKSNEVLAFFKKHFADQIPILEEAEIEFEPVPRNTMDWKIVEEIFIVFSTKQNPNNKHKIQFLPDGSFAINKTNSQLASTDVKILLTYLYENLIEQ